MAAPPAGMSYPQPVSRNLSRSDKRAVLTVPVLPTSAGSKTVSGTVYFSVCTDEQCIIKKQRLAVTINVEDAPDAATGS